MSDTAVIVAVMIVAAALGGGVLGGWWLAHVAQSERNELEQALGETIAQQQEEIMRLRDGEAGAGDLGL